MDEDDFAEGLHVENILDRKAPKKKKDGKAKGDRTERGLCKVLSDFFGVEFSRASGSGSRWSQVAYLPEHAKKTLSGDVCVPEGFKWVIESKGGYEDKIDLNGVLDGKGIAKIDEFIEQSNRDSEYCGRKSIICWKRSRRKWLAMVKQVDFPEGTFPYQIRYRDWTVVSLEELLEQTKKEFWFEEGASK